MTLLFLGVDSIHARMAFLGDMIWIKYRVAAAGAFLVFGFLIWIMVKADSKVSTTTVHRAVYGILQIKWNEMTSTNIWVYQIK